MADATDTPLDQPALRDRVRGTLLRLSHTGELPSLPRVTTAALALARKPDVDLDALCDVIQADVGVSARLLRVANSPVYGRRTPARRLRDVLTTLGVTTTCDVLVAASLRSLYQARNPRAQLLWEHSLAVAIAAEEVARITGIVRRGTCFLPGLLHDVGRIAFILTDPAPIDVIVSLSADAHAARTQLENEWYGFDHAAVGSTLGHDWGLPPDVCEALRWHHLPEMAPTGRELASVLHVADRMAHGLGIGAGLEPPPIAETPLLELSADDYAACEERTLTAFEAQKGLFR